MKNLRIVRTKSGITFEHVDDGLSVQVIVDYSETDDVLIAKLKKILSFVDPAAPDVINVQAQPLYPTAVLAQKPFTGVPPITPPDLGTLMTQAVAKGWEPYVEGD